MEKRITIGGRKKVMTRTKDREEKENKWKKRRRGTEDKAKGVKRK